MIHERWGVRRDKDSDYLNIFTFGADAGSAVLHERPQLARDSVFRAGGVVGIDAEVCEQRRADIQRYDARTGALSDLPCGSPTVLDNGSGVTWPLRGNADDKAIAGNDDIRLLKLDAETAKLRCRRDEALVLMISCSGVMLRFERKCGPGDECLETRPPCVWLRAGSYRYKYELVNFNDRVQQSCHFRQSQVRRVVTRRRKVMKQPAVLGDTRACQRWDAKFLENAISPVNIAAGLGPFQNRVPQWPLHPPILPWSGAPNAFVHRGGLQVSTAERRAACRSRRGMPPANLVS